MLAEKVIEIVAETHGVDASSISLDSTFEELDINSLQGLNIIAAVEMEFDVDVPNEIALGVRTVRDMVDGLQGLLAKRGESAIEQSE